MKQKKDVLLGDFSSGKSTELIMPFWAIYTFSPWNFVEVQPGVFRKEYADGTIAIIYVEQQKAVFNEKELPFDSPESFIQLECINRILELGYEYSDIRTDDFSFKGFRIRFSTWNSPFDLNALNNGEAFYTSRLVSGVMEYRSQIKQNNEIYDYGLFERKSDTPALSKRTVSAFHTSDFLIEENRVMKYVGNQSRVVIPEGIEELESCLFWDNQTIEEVVLPSTLKSMGGDTFYYCKNLRKVNIPRNVEIMGNNPFAGCPEVKIRNESPYFVYENGVLFTADMRTLIYCSIKGEASEYVVPDGVKVITKHAFYCCSRFKKITLPSSLEKMENNPFSGCSQLELINRSPRYYIQDDVIYNGFKTAVVGTLGKIHCDRLELLEGIKTINRNSFWNCKGIKTLVLPASLEDIGYNPFVDCENIRFENKSPYFKVEDGMLFNRDGTKLICCPSWRAQGEMHLPDSVVTLERGAFSGCRNMTEIHLHNVNVVNKSCFSNCESLKHLYCADWITYVGEWAFAYCRNLREVSVKKGTIVDNNAFSNCNAKLVERDERTNYLIESDNVYSLKAFQKAYHEKIDSFLIDPPYNSHIDYIGYKDSDYSEGYIAFISDRLKLAYHLLSPKGFLVLNIDEGEVDHLRDLCVSIFGEQFVSLHRWKKKHPFFDTNRVVLNPNKVQTDYEYIIICRKTEKAVFHTLMQPYIKDGQLFEYESAVPESFDCFGTTSSAKDEIKELFGTRDYFSTPKPVKLIKELIRATTEKDSLIMDFFAGSGTTGQACAELNREDGGTRCFLLVSNKESNICEAVTSLRLRKAQIDFRFVR